MNRFLIITAMLMNVTAALAYEPQSLGTSSKSKGVLANCKGLLTDGNEVKLRVQRTAAPSVIEAVLSYVDGNVLAARVYCEEGGQVSGSPSAGQVLWNCGATKLDKQTDDQLITIRIERGGPTGAVSAQVFNKQVFPYPPQVIGTLSCPKTK